MDPARPRPTPAPGRKRPAPPGGSAKDNMSTPQGVVDKKKRKRIGWYRNGGPVYSKTLSSDPAALCSVPASFQLIPILPPEGYQGTVNHQKKEPGVKVEVAEGGQLGMEPGPGDEHPEGLPEKIEPAERNLGGVKEDEVRLGGTDQKEQLGSEPPEGHLGTGQQGVGGIKPEVADPGELTGTGAKPAAAGDPGSQPVNGSLGTESPEWYLGSEPMDDEHPGTGAEPPKGHLGTGQEEGEGAYSGTEHKEDYLGTKPADADREIEPGDEHLGTEPLGECHVGRGTEPMDQQELNGTGTENLEDHIGTQTGDEHLGTEETLEGPLGTEHPGTETLEDHLGTEQEEADPGTAPILELEGYLGAESDDVHLLSTEPLDGSPGIEPGDDHDHPVTEPAADNLGNEVIEPPLDDHLEIESSDEVVPDSYEDHLEIEPAGEEIHRFLVGLYTLDGADPDANNEAPNPLS